MAFDVTFRHGCASQVFFFFLSLLSTTGLDVVTARRRGRVYILCIG